MGRKDFKVIFDGLVHDGIDPARLSPKAKAEISAALDCMLRLVKSHEKGSSR